MVVLRLSRGGAKSRPFFNVVATDSRNRRDGRFIERLGFYNPIAAANEQGLRLSMDRIAYWTGKGAQVSPTVQRLIRQFASGAAQAAPAVADRAATAGAASSGTADAATAEAATAEAVAPTDATTADATTADATTTDATTADATTADATTAAAEGAATDGDATPNA
jgi:small subunit ribosomal protein S16